MSDYYEVNGEDSIEINPFTEALLDELESQCVKSSAISATLIFLRPYKLRLINTTKPLIVIGGRGDRPRNSNT